MAKYRILPCALLCFLYVSTNILVARPIATFVDASNPPFFSLIFNAYPLHELPTDTSEEDILLWEVEIRKDKFGDILDLDIELNRDMPLEGEIRSSGGKIITQWYEDFEETKWEYRFHTARWAAGSYIITLRSGGQTHTKELMIE